MTFSIRFGKVACEDAAPLTGKMGVEFTESGRERGPLAGTDTFKVTGRTDGIHITSELQLYINHGTT